MQDIFGDRSDGFMANRLMTDEPNTGSTVIVRWEVQREAMGTWLVVTAFTEDRGGFERARTAFRNNLIRKPNESFRLVKRTVVETVEVVD